MNPSECLRILLLDHPGRRRVLERVRALELPDAFVAAGFIRNAVWDHLHEKAASSPASDVDVIWFNPADTDPETDHRIEARLREHDPTRNGDAPYRSACDAMRYWCETATAVAARLTPSGNLEIAAPLGLDDLFAMIIRPGPRFLADKREVYRARIGRKAWTEHWPRVRILDR
jgi:uncharacterized protein